MLLEPIFILGYIAISFSGLYIYPTYVFPYFPFEYVVVMISFVNPVTSFVVAVFVDVSL